MYHFNIINIGESSYKNVDKDKRCCIWKELIDLFVNKVWCSNKNLTKLSAVWFGKLTSFPWPSWGVTATEDLLEFWFRVFSRWPDPAIIGFRTKNIINNFLLQQPGIGLGWWKQGGNSEYRDGPDRIHVSSQPAYNWVAVMPGSVGVIFFLGVIFVNI